MNRKKLWQWHSWLGLIAGLPLLVIAVTGSLLVFHHEINGLLMPSWFISTPSEAGRLPLDHLHSAIIQALPEHHIVGWLMYENNHYSDGVYLWANNHSEWLRVFINPYTAEVLNAPIPLDDYLMEWIINLHYHFLAGHVGMIVTGVLALMLCALGILGFIIYRQFWVGFFTLRWRHSARVLTGDLHSRLGVISSVVFLVLGITGAWWNLPHALKDVYEHGLFDEPEKALTQPAYDHQLSLDNMLVNAQQVLPEYQLHYIAFPRQSGRAIDFYGALPSVNFLRSQFGNFVSFNAQSGVLIEAEDVREAPVGTQIEDTFRRLHFGDFGGLPIKIIWCLLGLAPGLLAVSGAFVYFKRKPARRRVRQFA